MPLPLAHGLLGATVIAALHPNGARLRPLILGAMLANLPDLDLLLLWGMQLRGIHRGFTHSLVFAIAFALVIYITARSRQWRNAMAFGLALMSHGILDFIAAKVGGGIMLFWPFSTERYKLDAIGLSELSRGLPVSELFYWSIWEVVIFLPLLILVFYLRKQSVLEKKPKI